MFTFFLCIALIYLGVGFSLGRWLLVRPLPHPLSFEHGDSACEVVEQHTATDHGPSLSPTETPADSTGAAKATAVHFAAPPKSGWKAAGNNLNSDIATLYERIRYAFSADDKQLVRDIATELRSRSRLWTTQLQQLIAELNAELERDPSAKLDCVTPELCLAQIETLQTNLELLDWTDKAESILGKLEREVEAVKKLMPANNKTS